MQFRVLGSLEVHDGTAAVTLRGRQQPKILALLLLEAGHAVGLPRIVDALWDDEPPATARQQVQNIVSALRRELARAGLGDTVTSVGDGYRLDVDATEYDAATFTSYVARARQHRAGGRDAEALDLLRDALALWRGPALAGLSGRHIDAGARRLEEARFSAIEERVDLELVLGEHRRLVGELRELLADHPFRQRLVGQLMLALYRGGRTTEALDVFTECRRGLAEELGIDPSAELRRLHEQILRADPALDPAPAAPVRDTTAPVPAQLPADTGSFAGRDGELAVLDALLEGGDGGPAALTVIAGAGGVGKTALAVHWAHLRRSAFPDGQLFVNLRGYDAGEPVPAMEVLARFLRALGASGDIPTGLDEAAALYRSLLAGRRVLVVLDNARSVEQVRPLLPGSPGCLALVTSREDLRGLVAFDDARPVALGALSAEASAALLTGLLGGERVGGDPSAVLRLARLCGYLPLALRIVAANLAGQPYLSLAEFAKRLDAHDRLDLLTVDGDPRATVAAAFDLSYTALDAPARELFRHLSLIPGADFSAALAAAVVDRPATETDRLLGRLVSAHLLERHAANRYRFHDLLRLYARQRNGTEDGHATRESIVDRVVDWFATIPEDTDGDEYAGRVAAILQLPPHPRTWEMAKRLGKYANDGFRLGEVRRCAEAGLDAAVRHNDVRGEAVMCSVLAITHWLNEKWEFAFEMSRRSIDGARAVGDRRTEGIAMGNLGLVYRRLDDLDTAERLMSQALAIARELGDTRHIRTRLLNTGLIHIGQARYADAERCLVEVLDIYRREDELHNASGAYQALAKLYYYQGRYADSLREAEAAVATASANQPRLACLALSARADARESLGMLNLAAEDFRLAAEKAAGLGQRGLTATIRVDHAYIQCRLGRQGEARAMALAAYEEMPESSSENTRAAAMMRLASIHLAVDEFEAAYGYATGALERFEGTRDLRNVARSLLVLGDACRRLGRVAEAVEHWGRALRMNEEIGLPDGWQLRKRLGDSARV